MTTSPAESLALSAAAAAIGTQRSGGSESELLDSAAVATIQSRASRRGTPLAARLPACPPDSRPECSPRAAELLHACIDTAPPLLISQWADLAISRGVRAPHALLPDLLNLLPSARDTRLLDAIRSIIDERGAWLARLNPAWAKAAFTVMPESPEQQWETGSRDERLALLKVVRTAEPARAIPLIQGTWETDLPDDRARFVEALDTGLSSADEPFLEFCLDDTRKPIRAAAAALLRCLTDSRLVARMTDRVLASIRYEPKKAILGRQRAGALVIEPPAEFDKAMARDGLDEQPQSKIAKRLSWLTQMLTAVPPTILSQRLNADPEPLIAAAKAHGDADQLLAALRSAAAIFKDQTWSSALLDLWALDLDPAEQPGAAQLLKAIDQPAAESLIRQRAETRKLFGAALWLTLAPLDRPWSPAFSGAIAPLLSGKPTLARTIEHAITPVCAFIHPSAADPLNEAVSTIFPPADRPASINKSLDLLRLRADLHKEFSP